MPKLPNYPKISNKFIILIALILVLAGAGFLGYQKWSSPETFSIGPISNNNDKKQKEAEKKTSIRLIAAGDMLPHDSINQAALTSNGYDYLPIMEDFKPFFEKADARFCVQAVPGGGAEFGITGYPVFNAPTEFTRDMAKLGCNIINSGTNHTNDKGQKLIDATLNAWDEQKGILAVAGANRSLEEQKKLRTFEIDGVKFAYLSYVTYTNTQPETSYGVNMFNESTAKAELKEARGVADIVLVSMRWGTEYSPDINYRQAELSKFLADNGADIVFGHGQHVQGPVKKLPKVGGGETIVWYGIGNFINSQLETEALFNGLPIMDIDIASKKVTNLSFLPFYMHYEWTPEQKAREDLLSRTNFKMYTFDKAEAPLEKSLLPTSVEDQTKRLQDVLNKFTKVTVINPDQY